MLNIKKYNNSNSIIVFASYPERNEIYGENISADASFTKNVVLGFKKIFPNNRIIVITLTSNKEEVYEEKDVLVIRTLKRNNPLSFIRALRRIGQFNKVKKILIEFEFSSFGDNIITGIFPIFLILLRLMRKEIIFKLHQCITNLSQLSGHIGLKKESRFMNTLNIAISLYYRVICHLSTDIIVTEEYLKTRLKRFTSVDKIHTIPLGVNIELDNNLSKEEAKDKLKINKNDYAILCFGYIGWYKGTDFIINTLKNVKKINEKNIKLIIAGGPSFTQEKKKHYQEYFKKTLLDAKNTNNTIITGFVKEKDISLYFSAADLITFPYRTFMSSSGSVSLAASFRKPFIISNKLTPLFHSKDILESLKESNLNPEDISFKLTKNGLLKTIKSSMNKKMNIKIKEFSSLLRAKRSFVKIVPLYKDIIFTNRNIPEAVFTNIFPRLSIFKSA